MGKLSRGIDADYVYDPSRYAKEPHDGYLRKYAAGEKRVLLLGMNPGPWGMAQTGVPFGAVPHVRDWLGITGRIGRPESEHPKRPVLGWDCPRVEPSGDRLWTLMASVYRNAAEMSRELVVINYCPLLLLRAEGGRCRNLPLDKVRGADGLIRSCDEHLDLVLSAVRPEVAIGIGAWAESRLRIVAPKAVAVDRMPHPSPASPLANRAFFKLARECLSRNGVG